MIPTCGIWNGIVQNWTCNLSTDGIGKGNTGNLVINYYYEDYHEVKPAVLFGITKRLDKIMKIKEKIS